MRQEEYDYIMAFSSHHRAQYIYERLLKRKAQVRLVTAPYKKMTSCTQAVKFKESDQEVVQEELKSNNIYPTAVYKIIRENGKEEYVLTE